jgi:myo-inositol-1(or 4)-monophosphatase
MSEIAQDETEEAYRFAIGLGRAAGKILLDGLTRRGVTVDNGAHEGVEKLNAVDIVTQTDNGMRLRA